MRTAFAVILMTNNVETKILFHLFHENQSNGDVLLLLFKRNYDDSGDDAADDICNVETHITIHGGKDVEDVHYLVASTDHTQDE